MMYIRGDVAIIQGKCPHAGVALGDVPLQELSVKRTLISMTQTHAWWSWASRQHGIKGISMQTYMRNMSIPSINNKQISKHNVTNNDSKYIPQMIPHHIKQESWKQGRNKNPHQISNRDLCSTIHSKRSTWTLFIYLTSSGHLKKQMSSYWICSDHQSHDIESHGNDCSLMNVDTYTPLWKVVEKWNEKMENLNTPSDSWCWIVQNWLSNFWILRKWRAGA